MSLVWRKIQRSNKKAAKFQFTAVFQELSVQCSDKWQPQKLCIAWAHRRRRHVTKSYNWEPSLTDPNKGLVMWANGSEPLSMVTTLYRHPRNDQFEDKEWIFLVEEINAKGRHKAIAAVNMNLRLFITDGPRTVTEVKLKLRPLSPHVKSSYMQLVLTAEVMKTGDANDIDMQSTASELSRTGSIRGRSENDIAPLDEIEADPDSPGTSGGGATSADTPDSSVPDEIMKIREQVQEWVVGREGGQQHPTSPSSGAGSALPTVPEAPNSPKVVPGGPPEFALVKKRDSPGRIRKLDANGREIPMDPDRINSRPHVEKNNLTAKLPSSTLSNSTTKTTNDQQKQPASNDSGIGWDESGIKKQPAAAQKAAAEYISTTTKKQPTTTMGDQIVFSSGIKLDKMDLEQETHKAERATSDGPKFRSKSPQKRAQQTDTIDDPPPITSPSSKAAPTTIGSGDDLLGWCQEVTRDGAYRGVKIENFTESFRSGLAFCALIHAYRPDLLDFDSLNPSEIRRNCELAFDTAARLGVPKLLDTNDFVILKVQEKISVISYVHSLRSSLTSRASKMDFQQFATTASSAVDDGSMAQSPSTSFSAASGHHHNASAASSDAPGNASSFLETEDDQIFQEFERYKQQRQDADAIHLESLDQKSKTLEPNRSLIFISGNDNNRTTTKGSSESPKDRKNKRQSKEEEEQDQSGKGLGARSKTTPLMSRQDWEDPFAAVVDDESDGVGRNGGSNIQTDSSPKKSTATEFEKEAAATTSTTSESVIKVLNDDHRQSSSNNNGTENLGSAASSPSAAATSASSQTIQLPNKPIGNQPDREKQLREKAQEILRKYEADVIINGREATPDIEDDHKKEIRKKAKELIKEARKVHDSTESPTSPTIDNIAFEAGGINFEVSTTSVTPTGQQEILEPSTSTGDITKAPPEFRSLNIGHSFYQYSSNSQLAKWDSETRIGDGGSGGGPQSGSGNQDPFSQSSIRNDRNKENAPNVIPALAPVTRNISQEALNVTEKHQQHQQYDNHYFPSTSSTAYNHHQQPQADDGLGTDENAFDRFRRFGSMRSDEVMQNVKRIAGRYYRSMPKEMNEAATNRSPTVSSRNRPPKSATDSSVETGSYASAVKVTGVSDWERGLQSRNQVEAELDEVQNMMKELCIHAEDTEKKWRREIDAGCTGSETERALQSEFIRLLTERDLLVRKEEQLNIRLQMEESERRFQLVQQELKETLEIDDSDKTESHKTKVDRLMEELQTLVNKKDELVQQALRNEQETEEDSLIGNEILELEESRSHQQQPSSGGTGTWGIKSAIYTKFGWS